MKNNQSTLRPHSKNRMASFIIIQKILIIIQATILLLLLAPHGYVHNGLRYANGYEMERFAYPISAIIFATFSIINTRFAKQNNKANILRTIQTFYIILHVSLLALVIFDSFKYLCIDTCEKYFMTNTIAGWTTFILYLAEFWLIIASAVLVRKANKPNQ